MSDIRINLSGGVTDVEQIIYGEGFYYAGGGSNIYVKFDNKTNESRLVKPKTNVIRKFEKIYISGNAEEFIELYVHKSKEEAINYPTELSSLLSSQLQHSSISISTTAVVVWEEADEIKEGSLRNWGDDIVYLGGSSVSSSNGYPLMPKEAFSINYQVGNIYAICGTGDSSEIRIIRTL